jgi:hypothetical protein
MLCMRPTCYWPYETHKFFTSLSDETPGLSVVGLCNGGFRPALPVGPGTEETFEMNVKVAPLTRLSGLTIIGFGCSIGRIGSELEHVLQALVLHLLMCFEEDRPFLC